VKKVTPPDKFHMMQLSQGWDPLASALKLSIPDTPFPRVNDADAVKGLELQILKEAGVRWLMILGLPLIMTIIAWHVLYGSD
jgi:hypothetical protein